MSRIHTVQSAVALEISLQPYLQDLVFVFATGQVESSGWTGFNLRAVFYSRTPTNGILDLEFVADPAVGLVLPTTVPAMASITIALPAWAKQIRILAKTNDYLTPIVKGPAPKRPPPPIPTPSSNPVLHFHLLSYEDSHQPTGTVHWKNDGPFGTPNPHPEFKKLVHSLDLNIDGPDQDQMRKCFDKAIVDGLVAGILAGWVSGGFAGVSTAMTALISSLQACLGASYTITADDSSHWEYWDA